MQYRAAKNFSGPDGKFYIGDAVAPADADRAKFLTDGGYIVAEEAPVLTTQPAPVVPAKPVAAPVTPVAK